MQLAAFLQRGERTSLWWAAVFTALAVLTRYPGVVLIGAGILMLLVRRTPPLAARLKDTVVFGAISSIPLAGVLTRNWILSDTLTGGRSGSGQSLFDSLSQVVDVFREWVIPRDAVEWFAYLLRRATRLSTSDWFGSLLWATTGLVVVAMVAVVVLSGRGKSPSFGLEPVLPFGVFAAIYLVVIVVIVPLTVPFVVHWGILARFSAAGVRAATVGGGVLVGPVPVHRDYGSDDRSQMGSSVPRLAGGPRPHRLLGRKNLRLTAQALEFGDPDDGTFNVAYRQHAATLKYIRDHLSDSITYSNNLFLLWFADRTAAIRPHQSLLLR